MKKSYLFLFVTMLFAATTQAQTTIFTEDFDNYSLGDLVGQSPNFETWTPGTPAWSSQVTDAQSLSGSQSMMVAEGHDTLLLLGDKSSGVYSIEWSMYIPSGFSGYYNFQKFETPGSFAGQVYIGDAGSGGIAGFITFDFSSIQIPYSSDTWVNVEQVIDLDNSIIKIYVDGVEMLNTTYGSPSSGASTNLGAIDFFGNSATSVIYLDDVVYKDITPNQTTEAHEAFDNYNLGDLVGQSSDFVLWPGGGATSAQVVNSPALRPAPGSKASVFVTSQVMLTRNNETDDTLFLLGDKSSGIHTIEWSMYVPSGFSGYYNFMEFENVANGEITGQVYVGASANGGVAGFITFDFSGVQIPYTPDTWIDIKHVIDLDNSNIKIFVDGVQGLDVNYANSSGPSTNLGAIDFFSASPTNMLYVDDILYKSGSLSRETFSTSIAFEVYPNPVKNELNIRSDKQVNRVVVYSILGKQVMDVQPNTFSPKIDVSVLSAGIYLVKIIGEKGSTTIKILKD